jgi:hypothetical protein
MYLGQLKMQGLFGTFRVGWSGGVVVDQFMIAQSSPRSAREFFLMGSLPRLAGSSQPATWYITDNFLVSQMTDGTWTISATCDRQKCAPVSVLGFAVGPQAK